MPYLNYIPDIYQHTRGKCLIKLTNSVNAKPALINWQDTQGKTALMLAVISGEQQKIDLLLQNGADPFIYDYSGKNAFNYADKKTQYKIQSVLHQPSTDMSSSATIWWWCITLLCLIPWCSWTFIHVATHYNVSFSSFIFPCFSPLLLIMFPAINTFVSIVAIFILAQRKLTTFFLLNSVHLHWIYQFLYL